MDFWSRFFCFFLKAYPPPPPAYYTPPGTRPGASENFRGHDALILLDGVPLSTPLRDGSRILDLLDLNAVERIETVAGASSLYGAGATGGTINIITRRRTEDGVRVTANAAIRAYTANVGRSLAPELSLGLQGRTGAFDYTGVLSRRATDRAGTVWSPLAQRRPQDQPPLPAPAPERGPIPALQSPLPLYTSDPSCGPTGVRCAGLASLHNNILQSLLQ